MPQKAKSPTRPWDKPNPQKRAGGSKPLTPDQKAQAKARAAKAVRPYPNLVDNMAAARMANAKSNHPDQESFRRDLAAAI